jgi:signal transduction histidine kinase
MRLSEFILRNREAILDEWERFAATLSMGASMTKAALRDDADDLLLFIADDMESKQSAAQQQAKAEGAGPASPGGDESAAHAHALHRLGEGFDINELMAEYRALRATVLRLWYGSGGRDEHTEADQIVRFNEALDQVIAESVLRFSAEASRAKDVLLGVLGHDLRNPLNAITMSIQVILRSPGQAVEVARRMQDSAERMRAMMADLLDFARTRLGSRLALQLAPCDLAAVWSQAADELRAAHPARTITFAVDGDLNGDWDRVRMGQLASNLVGNAVQHGDPDSPITVTAKGEADRVEITVHNFGPVITPEEARCIFDPLARGAAGERDVRSGSIGLGLYIAKQIAAAHAGDITLRSSDRDGTIFAVVLPRRVPDNWSSVPQRTAGATQ